MTTWMLILLICAVFYKLHKMESKEAQEDELVNAMVKASRHRKPRIERNPTRFGTIGYRTGIRRRSWLSRI